MNDSAVVSCKDTKQNFLLKSIEFKIFNFSNNARVIHNYIYSIHMKYTRNEFIFPSPKILFCSFSPKICACACSISFFSQLAPSKCVPYNAVYPLLACSVVGKMCIGRSRLSTRLQDNQRRRVAHRYEIVRLLIEQHVILTHLLLLQQEQMMWMQ